MKTWKVLAIVAGMTASGWMIGSAKADPGARKIEYGILRHSNIGSDGKDYWTADDNVVKLDERPTERHAIQAMGDDGWELVVVREENHAGFSQISYYFRR